VTSPPVTNLEVVSPFAKVQLACDPLRHELREVPLEADRAWAEQVLSARGFRRVGWRSEYAIHTV
jgi:hypothetical protein